MTEIPEGWVLVPREPTPEMVRAGSGAQNTVSDCGGGLVFAATETDIYRVMISAAPAAPNEWDARNALEVMRRNWQEKLDYLNDMKSRGDLTRDWGECSLITTRQIVSDLDAALGPAAPTEASDDELP